jgi:hypothetical protein
MHDGMMWWMGIGGLLALVIGVLVIAALIKYLFFAETGRLKFKIDGHKRRKASIGRTCVPFAATSLASSYHSE